MIDIKGDIVVATGIGLQTVKAGKLIYNYSESADRSGSTRTKGKVQVWDNATSLLIRPQLNVRKSGWTGTGRGSLNFQIVDKNFKPIVSIAHKLTVGAKPPGGTHTKKWGSPPFYELDKAGRDRVMKEGYFIVSSIRTDYDHNGMPQNMQDWLKAIGDLKLIYDVAVGDYASVGKWAMLKLAKNPPIQAK